MSKKSDYFFLNLKEIYPSFKRPSPIDEEIWAEMLEPFSEENIRAALKSYRCSMQGAFAPLPASFKDFLYPYESTPVADELPGSPETCLMEEDIKAGRCKYFFPVYARGVKYVLNVKLKEVVGAEVFKKFSTSGMRYRAAVDYGLFADFDKVLEIVRNGGSDV